MHAIVTGPGRVAPGLFLSAVIALAVSFISTRLGGPAMLYALLFGMAFNFLADDARLMPGIRFASRVVLRAGVALLGIRITTTDVLDLGWPVISLVAAAVAITIFAGWAIGRLCGLGNSHSLLSAGAVSICGAAATLAIASVLPPHENHERNTILTVATVTALSTVAMVVYPVFVSYAGFDDRTAGVFLGATIHDVAQVVGAGYIVSDESGATSTLVKLMRVACLVPVVLAISLFVARRRTVSGVREPLLPWFLVAFVVLVAVNSAGLVPAGPGRSWGRSPAGACSRPSRRSAYGPRSRCSSTSVLRPWPQWCCRRCFSPRSCWLALKCWFDRTENTRDPGRGSAGCGEQGRYKSC